jgi:hypothetical protein
MPKSGGEGPKGPTWKSFRSAEEIERLNAEAAKERGLIGGEDMRRDQLLAGIDKEQIMIARKKAEQILAVTTEVDRVQAEGLMETMANSNHPKDMIAIFHGMTEQARRFSSIEYAAMAMAFLSLTEKKD